MSDEEDIIKPVLYILMRSDMDSLNAGKGMAQAAHAANDMVKRIRGINEKSSRKGGCSTIKSYLDIWEEQAGGFGTTIVLDIYNEDILKLKVNAIQDNENKRNMAGIVHDPTYPVRDGEVTHLVPVNTCGWVFGDREELSMLMEQFDLHP